MRKKTGMQRHCPSVAVMLATMMIAGITVAGSARGADDAYTTERFIEELKKQPAAQQPPAGASFRGIKVVPAEGESVKPSPPPSIDVRIEFEFNSATLTPSARSTLDKLGAALTSAALREDRFELAGHTDATGTPAYNLELSKQRSAAARDYLIDRFEIEPSRLTATGFGETRPLPGMASDAAEQRRVQITNLGS